MKHTPKAIAGSTLADRIIDREDVDSHDFSMVVNDDRTPIESVGSVWFVIDWPEHCVTGQHLGDATIHGPYTEAEAMEFPGVELY